MRKISRETMMLGIMVKCSNGEESFGTEITGTLMIFIGSMTQQTQHGLFGASKDA
jgi:hypothetical protein